MVWLRALFQVAAAAAFAAAASALIGTGAGRPALLTNALYASALGLALALASALTQLSEERPARWIPRLGSATGIGLAAALVALLLCEGILAGAGAAGRATLCGSVARARGAIESGLMTMLAGMLSKVVLGAVLGVGAAAAACRPLELPARGRALAASAAIGGAVGGLALELALWLAPSWRLGAASPILATAWLGALVALGLALGEELGPVARLTTAGGSALRLFAGRTPIGSAEVCAVRLHGDGVLTLHAVSEWRGGRVELTAEPGATLELNGRPVSVAALGEGDEIRLGGAVYTVRYNLNRVRSVPAGHMRERRPVDDAPAGPRLVGTAGAMAGESFAVPEGLTVLGSGPDAGIRIPDDGVAERHATLLRRGREVRITDEPGTSGVRVDGQATPTARLTAGSRVEVGAAAFVFLVSDDD